MAKILIVEDNQGTNKAICEYMKEAGHTLFSAFTGSEALKIFREKELDIIVLPHDGKRKKAVVQQIHFHAPKKRRLIFQSRRFSLDKR